MLDKTAHIVMLKDFYGPLLTEKQQQVLSLYYENDWSLAEIAASYNITRQAIFDLLKRAENSLMEYERKLGLVARFNDTQVKLEAVYYILNSSQDLNQVLLNKALHILREITEDM